MVLVSISWCSDHLISCDLVFGVDGLTSNFMLRLEVDVQVDTLNHQLVVPFETVQTVSDRFGPIGTAKTPRL